MCLVVLSYLLQSVSCEWSCRTGSTEPPWGQVRTCSSETCSEKETSFFLHSNQSIFTILLQHATISTHLPSKDKHHLHWTRLAFSWSASLLMILRPGDAPANKVDMSLTSVSHIPRRHSFRLPPKDVTCQGFRPDTNLGWSSIDGNGNRRDKSWLQTSSVSDDWVPTGDATELVRFAFKSVTRARLMIETGAWRTSDDETWAIDSLTPWPWARVSFAALQPGERRLDGNFLRASDK
jgi:hypothetical protein